MYKFLKATLESNTNIKKVEISFSLLSSQVVLFGFGSTLVHALMQVVMRCKDQVHRGNVESRQRRKGSRQGDVEAGKEEGRQEDREKVEVGKEDMEIGRESGGRQRTCGSEGRR